MAILIPTGIDADTGQFKIFDPSTDTVVTPLGFVRVLGSVTGIDGTATGTTTILTVPADKQIVAIGATIFVESISGFVSEGAAGIGVASGEDDIFSSVNLTGLNSAGKCFQFFNNNAIFKIATFNDVIKFGMDTAFNASSITLSVSFYGYYKV